MIIQSNQIRTGASRSYQSSCAGFMRHDAWNASGNMLFSLGNSFSERTSVRSRSQNGSALPGNEQNAGSSESKKSAVNSGADNMQDLMEQMSSSSGARKIAISDAINNLQKLRQQALDYLLDMLFGRRSRADTLYNGSQSFSETVSSAASEFYGAGESYYSSFYYSERETTCFDAKGTAVTADGREISFSVSLEMSRSFTQIAGQQIDFGKPRLCDPLVVNLSGNGADVTDQKFFFDIDADGEQEYISSLGSGSGYLALDKNGNGQIDDGSELFGTDSGNGFSDLSSYDSDGNGWIDEADAIFSMLKIWVRDEKGGSRLLSLAEAGIGAIGLGHEDTEFSVNNATDNHTNAIVRKTGIFLYENGSCGTIQQLDLAT